MLDHQNGVIVFLVSLMGLYLYYALTVQYQMVFCKSGYSYESDAEIRKRHINTNKEYCFYWSLNKPNNRMTSILESLRN